MELRQLAAIAAVADHGTFSAAADALGTVQSNVSAHVARLERELGVVLFDRSRGDLTEEGKVVVTRARHVLSEVEALVSDVAAVRNDVSGTVRVGVIGTTGRWLAPRLLAATAERYPAVRIAVVEGSSVVLAGQLDSGKLDMAVTNLPVTESDVTVERLFDEDLVLVVARSDPLAGREEIDLSDLRDLPLLLPMPGTAFRHEIDAATVPAGFELVAKAELDGVRFIASLTFEGYGPAILPATAVPGFLRDRWAPVPVRGLPRRQVGLAVRRRAVLSAPARAVRDLLGEVVADQVMSGGSPGLHPPTSDGSGSARPGPRP
ncbi:MAG TPA: LysR family transcriptional regulator [Acidimicrobiales bacterium]|nr:LysR family transcriptional regulator [Acidimicrobiales bacterium]